MSKLNSKHEIDVVISWVDGNDPKHQEKLSQNMVDSKRDEIFGAHPTRFNSVNEIKYCVLSILKFAPFVRRIFIITDDQNPNIDEDIKSKFPERLKDIRIVDHKEIFEGYEQFLPTFNSRSIETFMWRIKGLADKFVYFNDDFFLIKPIKPTDWFKEGRPVMRGRWRYLPMYILLKNYFIENFKKLFFQIDEPHFNPIHKVSIWKGANKVGFWFKFIKTDHTPRPINRLRLEEYYNTHKSTFSNNARYKFRHYKQYNTVALANHLEVADNNTNIEFQGTRAIYLEPVNVDSDYVDHRIYSSSKKDALYMCAQNLDMAKKEDLDKVINYLDKVLVK